MVDNERERDEKAFGSSVAERERRSNWSDIVSGFRAPRAFSDSEMASLSEAIAIGNRLEDEYHLERDLRESIMR